MKTKSKDWIASFNETLEDMLPKVKGDTLQHVGSDNPSTQINERKQ